MKMAEYNACWVVTIGCVHLSSYFILHQNKGCISCAFNGSVTTYAVMSHAWSTSCWWWVWGRSSSVCSHNIIVMVFWWMNERWIIFLTIAKLWAKSTVLLNLREKRFVHTNQNATCGGNYSGTSINTTNISRNSNIANVKGNNILECHTEQ